MKDRTCSRTSSGKAEAAAEQSAANGVVLAVVLRWVFAGDSCSIVRSEEEDKRLKI